MGDDSHRVSRRRLLALVGAGVATAGCGGEGGTGGTGTPTDAGAESPTDAGAESPTDAGAEDPTATPGGTPTRTPTPTATATPTPTATLTPTPAEGPRVLTRDCDGSVLDTSPGAHFAPTDGFAAPGWLDGEVSVVVVTTLDASGEGSLRWALERSGPRIVVFEVGGVVDLAGEHLEVGSGQCWIAGQTAPSPGITLVRGGLYVEADDCVVQHLRVRAGDAGRTGDWEPDAAHTADDSANNVFDHVTASWGVDETLSVGYRTADTTLSNCIVAEGLRNATHHEGAHSAGSLIGDGAGNVSLLGNLYYANVTRNPLMKGETTNVLANNLVSHFGPNGVLMLETTRAAFVGNAFVDPVDPSAPVIERDGEAYFEDNHTTAEGPLVDGVAELDAKPLWPDGLEALPAGEVRDQVAANAGARPADRAPHDERVVENVRLYAGGFVDSQSDVGGYPDLDPAERPLDVPREGFGEWLAAHTRAVEFPDAEPP